MIKAARGNRSPTVEKIAARMKDQWRRRVSLALLAENATLYTLLASARSARWRPRGRGLAAGWTEAED